MIQWDILRKYKNLLKFQKKIENVVVGEQLKK